MLSLVGSAFKCCDGVSRRRFLKVGTLGLGGLTLADLLRHQAAGTPSERASRPEAAVIFIELAGGPSHFETYDPKPDAPKEYRGPLGSIATALPGVSFSELMERQAAIADRLAIIRSISHESSSHQTSSHLVQTGYYLRDRQNTENEMPCVGSVAAQVCGPRVLGLPAFVSIPRSMRYGRPAYLGKSCGPFETITDANSSKFSVKNLTLEGGLDLDRLENRKHLLAALDAERPLIDSRGETEAIDDFTRQAFEMVTGPLARKAFDIQAEKEKVRDAYGRNTTGQSLLLARRLIDAGVRFVTVRVPGWDDHTKIAQSMRKKGPPYDQGLAALVEDLHKRHRDTDVLVVAMGEFGRTPRVNRTAGRDHWGNVMSVLMAGGGLKMGQVIGSSSAKGEAPKDNPYRPENVLAMIYRHLGIDTESTFEDLSGRPRYVLERRELINELV